MTLSNRQINLLTNKIWNDYHSWIRAIKTHKSYDLINMHWLKTTDDSLLLKKATHKSFAFVDNFHTAESALSISLTDIHNATDTFKREIHDYRYHDDSEQRWYDKTFGRTTFSKSDLIDMAQDELAENAGWWNPADASNKEEAKGYRQNLDDIHKTENLLDQGKLEDPYGSIDNAYDDYYHYLLNSDDEDFADDDKYNDGARGKRTALNELDALHSEVD